MKNSILECALWRTDIFGFPIHIYKLGDSLFLFFYKDQLTERSLIQWAGIACKLFFQDFGLFGADYSFAIAPNLFLQVVQI